MELNLSIKTKAVLAVITVIVSLVLGLYTKALLTVKFLTFPDNWWAYLFDWQWWLQMCDVECRVNLGLYIFSWVILFVAGFFVGKEALEIADMYVKKKLQETYTATVDLHKEGLKRGIETTKKGFETTRDIGKKTIHFHKRMLGIDELEFQKKQRKKK